MGQSGAGSGGNGTGGSSGGGAGQGYNASPDAKGREASKRVLAKLKPSYLIRQFGSIAPEIVRQLVMMSIDLTRGGSWRTLCERLEIDAKSSLQDVRDAIFRRSCLGEHDQRVIGASRASLATYFEELTGFDDDLLTQRNLGAQWLDRVEPDVARDALERYLALLTENILLREEPNSLSKVEADALSVQANRLGKDLAGRLRTRYQKSGDAGDGRVLARATKEPNERDWFLKRLRA